MLFLAMGAAAGAEEDTNGETLEAFVKRWVESFNGNNANRTLAFYDKAEDLEVIVSVGKRFRGYREWSEILRADVAMLRFSGSKAQSLVVRTLGDTALASFEHRFEVREKKSGTGLFRAHIRTTMTLRRIGGLWRIVLEHSSPIFGIEFRKPLD
ncbi:MAG: nuclear transport factor 2 family protein [Roseibacillus sp.]